VNLNTLRHIKLLRGGEIRAWALTGRTYQRIIVEMGYDDGTPWASDVHLLDIPVVIIRPGEPEGVIV
jgi:hypothetical protein